MQREVTIHKQSWNFIFINRIFQIFSFTQDDLWHMLWILTFNDNRNTETLSNKDPMLLCKKRLGIFDLTLAPNL